jgi:two-component system cell cycle response regulator
VPDNTAQVLLIEDGDADRLLVRELLQLKGRGRLSVTEARDLRGGLEWLGKQTFDLVLLDTKLPEVTALHALRAIGEQAPTTPILTHPAYISVRTRQAARERGAFDVVVRGDLNLMWSAVTKLLSLTERLY